MRVIRFNKYRVFLYAILIAQCIGTIGRFPGILELVLRLFRLASYFVSAFLFFKNKYFQRKAFLALYGWFVWIIVGSFLNGTDTIGAVSWDLPLFSSAVLSIYLIEHDRENFFRRISWTFAILLAVQVYSFITNCFGVDLLGRPLYLFGIRVKINKITPFAVFFGLLTCKYGNKQSALSLLVSTACGLYFVIMNRVSSSLVGYAIIFLVFVGMKRLKNKHFVRNMTILALLIFSSFTFLYSENGILARWFFEDLLEEGLTLNNRTIIWEQAMNYVKGIHWLIGNGYNNGITFFLRYGKDTDAVHNQYLSTVFNYGFIGLAIYILMCVSQLKRVGMRKVTYCSRVFYSVFIAMIAMQIPATLFERPYYYIFYVASMYLTSFELSDNPIDCRTSTLPGTDYTNAFE